MRAYLAEQSGRPARQVPLFDQAAHRHRRGPRRAARRIPAVSASVSASRSRSGTDAVHERLSVHSVTFLGATLPELQAHWQALGRHPAEPDRLPTGRTRSGATHREIRLFGRHGLPPVRLDRTDCPVSSTPRRRVGARAVYMLTGGRGRAQLGAGGGTFLRRRCTVCRSGRAGRRGIGDRKRLRPIRRHPHRAHPARHDHARRDGRAGICIDLFHCWAEAGLGGLVERALPRTQQIQLSDYVLGDRSLPARAVPGDGAIPIEPFVAQVLAGGYAHGFDLELIGPRIEREGRFEAARRGCETVSTMLERLGA